MSGKGVGVKQLAREYIDLAAKIVGEARADPKAHPLHRIRDAVALLDVGEQRLVVELWKLAQQYGGCISCRHSAPNPECLSLVARFCRLGLAQGTCKRWEPLV